MKKENSLNSLSVFVGTGECNADCEHCAGKIHRKYAPKKDGIIDYELIYKTLKKCHKLGARSLSISSSGEPTLSPNSVTNLLRLVYECKNENIHYPNINLYSNGIRIGFEDDFCNKYLPLWKKLGLKKIYITLHNIEPEKNAKTYRIKEYPSLNKIISNIHNHNLLIRANLVLSKKTILNLEKFVLTVNHLDNLGVDLISAWGIRDEYDKLDINLSPDRSEMNKMEKWVLENKKLKSKLRLLREKDRNSYKSNKKLTLFPDGTLSNKWC